MAMRRHRHHMHPTLRRCALLLAALSSVGCSDSSEPSRAAARPPAPVAVASIEQRPITLRRSFSGALEATAEVMVAPRVSGQLTSLVVDIGDVIERGQVVATIDDAELQQAVLQAEAEEQVAQANQEEADAAHEIASRAFDRTESLSEQGVASASELDAARATALARRSRTAVTRAQVARAAAGVEAARIRLAEAQVHADWEPTVGEIPGSSAAGDGSSQTSPTRLVAMRFADEGTFVSAGTPLLSIVALQPIVAVIFVPERDYANLKIDQQATLTTDAYPLDEFTGRVARIAPVFSRATRQVRVELEVNNEDRRLKPGMFVRATLELAEASNATVVPYAALTKRDDRIGVFVLDASGDAVRWQPVDAGIREGRFVQVLNAQLSGTVVTLGQDMCDDGASVSVIESLELTETRR